MSFSAACLTPKGRALEFFTASCPFPQPDKPALQAKVEMAAGLCHRSNERLGRRTNVLTGRIAQFMGKRPLPAAFCFCGFGIEGHSI
jgi:hypothetical protein